MNVYIYICKYISVCLFILFCKYKCHNIKRQHSMFIAHGVEENKRIETTYIERSKEFKLKCRIGLIK